MTKLLLALAFAGSLLASAAAFAQTVPALNWQDSDNAAPSIREFSHSANGG